MSTTSTCPEQSGPSPNNNPGLYAPNVTVGMTGLTPHTNTSACTYDSGAPYFRYTSGKAYLVSVESSGPTCPHTAAAATSTI